MISDPESSLMPSRDYCVGLISGVVNSFDGRSAYFTWKRDLLCRSRLKTERCSPRTLTPGKQIQLWNALRALKEER